MEKSKVLIIEDNEIDMQICVSLYQNFSFEIRQAISGEMGLEILRDFVPDIIILDIYLPGISGIQMLDELHAIKELKNTTIVLVTADDSEDTMMIGLLKGANDFIKKPINLRELAAKTQSFIEQKRKKDQIDLFYVKLEKEKNVLSQYFSEDVIQKIVSGDFSEKFRGENINASILFFDIRGFTTISEYLEPSMVAELINYIFTDIIDLIFSHGGSVNKLLGDAILATFGCPISTKQDAYNAVKCAVAIKRSLDSFNLARPKYLKENIAFGVGISTGIVFAGNVGSYRRMEYTVLGDVVNTASRLQNLTKKVKVTILIDGATRQQAGPEKLKTRRVALHNVRGKSNSIDIFSLDGITEEEKDSESVFF